MDITADYFIMVAASPFHYGYYFGLIPSRHELTPSRNHSLVGNFHIIGTMRIGLLFIMEWDIMAILGTL